MFKKLSRILLNFFRPTVHREKNFVIKRLSASDYLMIARNRVYATLKISDGILFVEVFFKENDDVVTRYCVNVDVNAVSNDTFVITQMQNNVLFNTTATFADSVIRNHFDTFRSIHFLSDCRYNQYDGPQVKHHYFDNKYYAYIQFTRKKVITHAYRYIFKTFSLNNDVTTSQYYVVGDILLSISSLDNYIHTFSKTNRNNIEYGIDNQLESDVLHYTKYINPKDVIMLRKGTLMYCHMYKNNGAFHLSFLDNFHYSLDRFKPATIAQKFMRLFFNVEHKNPVYSKAQLVSIVCKKGKLKVNRSSFDQSFAKSHEMAISSMIRNNLPRLRLTHPSAELLHALSELGLPHDLPLSEDSLTVLDMFNI